MTGIGHPPATQTDWVITAELDQVNSFDRVSVVVVYYVFLSCGLRDVSSRMYTILELQRMQERTRYCVAGLILSSSLLATPERRTRVLDSQSGEERREGTNLPSLPVDEQERGGAEITEHMRLEEMITPRCRLVDSSLKWAGPEREPSWLLSFHKEIPSLFSFRPPSVPPPLLFVLGCRLWISAKTRRALLSRSLHLTQNLPQNSFVTCTDHTHWILIPAGEGVWDNRPGPTPNLEYIELRAT